MDTFKKKKDDDFVELFLEEKRNADRKRAQKNATEKRRNIIASKRITQKLPSSPRKKITKFKFGDVQKRREFMKEKKINEYINKGVVKRRNNITIKRTQKSPQMFKPPPPPRKTQKSPQMFKPPPPPPREKPQPPPPRVKPPLAPRVNAKDLFAQINNTTLKSIKDRVVAVKDETNNTLKKELNKIRQIVQDSPQTPSASNFSNSPVRHNDSIKKTPVNEEFNVENANRERKIKEEERKKQVERDRKERESKKQGKTVVNNLLERSQLIKDKSNKNQHSPDSNDWTE
jgi:hypothetical protein